MVQPYPGKPDQANMQRKMAQAGSVFGLAQTGHDRAGHRIDEGLVIHHGRSLARIQGKVTLRFQRRYSSSLT